MTASIPISALTPPDAVNAALSSSVKNKQFQTVEGSSPAVEPFAAILAALGTPSVQIATQRSPTEAAILRPIGDDGGKILPPLSITGRRISPQDPPAGSLLGGRIPPTARTQHVALVDARTPPTEFTPPLREEFATAGDVPRPLNSTWSNATEFPIDAARTRSTPVAPMHDGADPRALINQFRLDNTLTTELPNASAAPAMPGVTSASGSSAAASMSPTFSLASPNFGDNVTQHITVLVRDGVQRARIQVSPAELGPLELRIAVNQDEATVHIASQHGAVRDALEDALPRLKEQLENAGLRLSESGIYNELPQSSADSSAVDDGPEDVIEDVDQSALSESAARANLHVGLINTYV